MSYKYCPRILFLSITVVAMVVACGDAPDQTCERPEFRDGMLETEFVLIAPGTFEMGGTSDELWSSPPMQVTLTHPYWIQTTAVTEREFRSVSAQFDALQISNGVSVFALPGEFYSLFARAKLRIPPTTPYFGWPLNALQYANARSILEGLEPCYDVGLCKGLADAREFVPNWGELHRACAMLTSTQLSLDCEGYRLPTEAEWEFAARAGTTTEYATGDTSHGMWEFATLRGTRNYDPELAYQGVNPVARSCPNDWGLYDMQGGSVEWTSDLRGSPTEPPNKVYVWNYAESLVDPIHRGNPVTFDPTNSPWYIRTEEPSSDTLLTKTVLRGAPPWSTPGQARLATAFLEGMTYEGFFRVVRRATPEEWAAHMAAQTTVGAAQPGAPLRVIDRNSDFENLPIPGAE